MITDNEQVAKQAARLAVRELFLTLGANIDDPSDVISLQRDFAHLRDWRKASEAVKAMGLRTAVGIVVTSLIGLIWLAVSGKH